MSLGNLHNSTYTSNVDNTRRVAFEVSTALVEQTEKSCCHVVDREGIDLVERSPCVRAVVIKKCISKGLSVGIFWRMRIVEEIRKRSRDSGTEKVGELVVSTSLANDSYLFTRMCNLPSFSSIRFLASIILSRLETSRGKLARRRSDVGYGQPLKH
jgi:hypothetical protein